MERTHRINYLQLFFVKQKVGVGLKVVFKHGSKSGQPSPPPQNYCFYIVVSVSGPRLEAGHHSNNAPSFCEKLKDLTRPEMMRPLRLVVIYFFFYHCAGITGLRPYMVKVFDDLELTIDPYWLTVSVADSDNYI